MAKTLIRQTEELQTIARDLKAWAPSPTYAGGSVVERIQALEAALQAVIDILIAEARI